MLTIRKAKLSDVERLVELFCMFRKEHDSPIVKLDPEFKDRYRLTKDATKHFRKFIIKHIRARKSNFDVAELNGKVIGYLVSYIVKDEAWFKNNELGYLRQLFVEKGHRGNRISSQLKDSAFAWFKKRKINYVYLDFYVKNSKAHSIYRKWGLKEAFLDMRKKI